MQVVCRIQTLFLASSSSSSRRIVKKQAYYYSEAEGNGLKESV